MLIFCDYYLPGFKAGGPAVTIRNIVLALRDRLDISIVTRPRDLGDNEDYSGITVDRWTDCEGARILYRPATAMTVGSIRQLIETEAPDVVYLNSTLSRRYSAFVLMAIRLMRLFGGKTPRIVLAPRGEFSSGALALKPLQKKLYFAAVKALGLWRDLTWQCSSEFEAADLRRIAGKYAVVRVLADLATPVSMPDAFAAKASGEANIIFVGRISPIKNLHTALSVVRRLKGRISFSIVGPIEDKAYWELCQREIETMPANVTVVSHGAQAPDRVMAVMQQADIFFLPSLGENYAHVVPEALGAGCPVVVSDRTPWRDLGEQGIGAVVAVEDGAAMAHALQDLVDIADPQFRKMRERCIAHARSVSRNNALNEAYFDLLSTIADARRKST